jgi:hypothetical protein
MARHKALAAVVFLAAAFFHSSLWATDRTWTGGTVALGTTAWGTVTNWLGGIAPGLNDRAIIPNAPSGGRFPTISTSPVIGQLWVQGAAIVTINNGSILTINGTTNLPGPGVIAASPVIDGTGTVTRVGGAGTGAILVTGGTAGGTVINDTMTLCNFTFNPAAALQLGVTSGKTVTFNGDVTVQTGTMHVGNAGGSTLAITGNLSVAGTLNMRGPGGTIRLAGNLTFTGTWTPGLSSTVILDGTSNVTLTLNAAAYSFWDLTIQTDAGANQVNGDLVTPNAGFTVNNNLTITRGQFQIGAFTVTVNGNVSSGASAESQLDFTAAGTLLARGDVDLGSLSQVASQVAGPFATIVMGAPAVARTTTFHINAAASTQYHDLDALQISNPSGVIVRDNISLNTDFTVNGQLVIDPGCTLTVQDVFDPESPLIMGAASVLRLENIISPDSSIMGTAFTPSTGTVIYAGPGIAQIVYALQSNGTPIQYYNLTIDNSGGVTASQQAAPLAVLNNLTIGTSTAAIFTAANGQTITVGNDFISNGTFNAGGSTVVMTTTADGTGMIAASIPAPAALTFNNLTVSGGVVATPNGAPVATLQTVAGNVTAGSHSYQVSFVDGNNFESATGPGSNVVTADATHGRVDLSLIPIGPAGIVKRRLYRTVAGNGAPPLLLAEITDNTTTTFTDNIADASLGALGATKPREPATALTATIQNVAGNVNVGTHSYRVTYVDGGNLESAVGPSSNIITATAAQRQVNLTAIPTGPAGTAKRRIYRTVAGNGGNPLFLTEIANNTTVIFTDNIADASLGVAAPTTPLSPATALTATLVNAAGNVTVGSHSYKVTYVDGSNVESAAGPGSNVVTATAAQRQISLTAIPTGPAGIVKRRIYRTVAGNAGNPLFLAEIIDNTTAIFTDNTSDGSLGPVGPLTLAPPGAALTATLVTAAGNVNLGTHSYKATFVDGSNVESAPGPGSNVIAATAAQRQVNLTAIPIGPAGTAKRRLYRTVSGNGGSPLFLTEIANNTTTVFTDNFADASLGVAPPPAAPSGSAIASLSSVAGIVTAGAHSYYVTFVDALNLESATGPASNVVTPSGGQQVILFAIPVGPAGTTVVKRRLYRTVAGDTGNPLFLAEIADNTTTEYVDNIVDASLGAAVSTANQLTVLTAARNFNVGNFFLVPRGKLTLAAGVTVDAQNGLTVGDNVLPTSVGSDATLELIGNVTLKMGTGKTMLVQPDGVFFAGLLSSATGPTLTCDTPNATFLTSILGVVDVTRLTFSQGGASGLNINTTAAKVRNLRNITFAAQDPSLGGTPADLTILAPGLDFDCPGCVFGTLRPAGVNVRAKGANTTMRLRFEDRGASPTPGGGGGGAGAGELRDDDDDTNDNGIIDGAETAGGSIVQWVYTANIDMKGAIQGYPEPAFDWNTGIYYSTYVVMRQGAGLDVIYVLDGNGDQKPGPGGTIQSFAPGSGSGTIVGPLYWTTEAGIGHVVYFGTSTGRVYKLVDNGSGTNLTPPAGFWSTYFTNANLDGVTTPIIADSTNLYFGGFDVQGVNTVNGFYRIASNPPAAPNPPVGYAFVSTATLPVTSMPSWADTTRGRFLFSASIAVGGVSSIYRVDTTSWAIDASFASTTSFTAATSMPQDVVYVGELSGKMQGLLGLGPVNAFVTAPGFPFTASQPGAIRGGAGWDGEKSRLLFGNDAGNFYTLNIKQYVNAWTLGTTYFVLATGATPIQAMPLVQDGVLYAPNSGGKLFVIDVFTGFVGPPNPPAQVNQSLFLTYNLGTAPLGDLSRDSLGSGRIYVGTAGSRLYAIAAAVDPTAAR